MASGSNSPSVGGTKIFFNQPTINSEFVIRIYKKLDEICKILLHFTWLYGGTSKVINLPSE